MEKCRWEEMSETQLRGAGEADDFLTDSFWCELMGCPVLQTHTRLTANYLTKPTLHRASAEPRRPVSNRYHKDER